MEPDSTQTRLLCHSHNSRDASAPKGSKGWTSTSGKQSGADIENTACSLRSSYGFCLVQQRQSNQCPWVLAERCPIRSERDESRFIEQWMCEKWQCRTASGSCPMSFFVPRNDENEIYCYRLLSLWLRISSARLSREIFQDKFHVFDADTNLIKCTETGT